jgi:hypothetical protein
MGGYLPQVFERFGSDYPAVMEAFRGLAERLHEAGPLSARERRLAKLGIAIGGESEGASDLTPARASPKASSPRPSGMWRCSLSRPEAIRPPWLPSAGSTRSSTGRIGSLSLRFGWP